MRAPTTPTQRSDPLQNFWNLITSNNIINATVLSWFVAQALKVLIILLRYRKLDMRKFLQTGGMPSSHSSTVATIAVCIGRSEGVTSPLFALAIVYALITMHDAAGVRRAAGKQARVLNQIIESWDKPDFEFVEKKLIEFLGHTRFEVFMGALLGIIIGLYAAI